MAESIMNHVSLFPIARLKNFTSTLLISTCNDYTTIDNAYYKASLIKVIEVYILNPILLLYIVY